MSDVIPAVERPTCGTCPYWKEELAADLPRGYCRRHSPRWLGYDDGDDWSATLRKDWCGEHPDFPRYLASRRPDTTQSEGGEP